MTGEHVTGEHVTGKRASRRGRAATALRATLAVLLVSTGLGVLTSGTALAEEIWARPTSGVWVLGGHGFGHGRGMSQWGAAGAAAQGVSATDILAFYYPGTTRTSVPNDVLRVRLTGPDTTALRVSQATGLAVVESTGTRTELPADRTQWRLVPSGTGLQLQGQVAGAWTAYPLGGQSSVPAPVRFEAPAALLRLWRADNSSVDYRGSAAAHLQSGSVLTVLSLPLESYLRGVVPAESPASWPAAALQAQSVAARSYAVSAVRRNPAAIWHICDTTACQVFNGTTRYSSTGSATPVEYASTDAAILATAGVVLTYAGAIALTEFSASNGGWTVAGGVPYQVAKPDPWSGTYPGDTAHAWTASLPVATLEARYPSVGTVTRLVVTSRDGNGEWGGRVLGMRLEGSAGSVTLTGNDIRSARPYPTSADGVRSNWFTVTDKPPFGVLDSVSFQADALSVRGWTIDPNTTGPVSVQVRVGDRVAATVPAEAWRPDVGAAYPGFGDYHGLDTRVPPARGGPNTVCLDALNVGTNGPTPTRLGCADVYVPERVLPALVSSGGSVDSVSGAYRLVVQADGNLVIYRVGVGVRWTTMTFVPGSVLRMQPDGNLVLYAATGRALWTSATAVAGSVARLQDDGNLVIYTPSGAPVWDSDGRLGRPGVRLVEPTVVTALASGQSALSSNHLHSLTMRTDGALVLTGPTGQRWTSRTSTPGSVLRVQADGNVVVTRPNGTVAWHAGVQSPGATLVLQDDGNAVLYSTLRRPLWDALGYLGNPGQWP